MMSTIQSYLRHADATPLLSAFRSALLESFGSIAQLDSGGQENRSNDYREICADGYLSTIDSAKALRFKSRLHIISGRKFYEDDSFVDDNPALLGCYLGLATLGLLDESGWFQTILNTKRKLGGPHADFCDAISGKCPEKGHTMIELYLFLRQRESAVQMVDSTLREWMLEHWHKPFPYFNDFFRNVVAVRVMEDGMGMVLGELENRSVKIHLTVEECKMLGKVKKSIGDGRIGDAFDQLEMILSKDKPNEIQFPFLELKGQWGSHTMAQTSGLAGYSETTISENLIRKRLLDFLERLMSNIPNIC